MMRRFNHWFILIIQLLSSCGYNDADTTIKNDIPGMYITSYEGQYSIGEDTIEIRRQDPPAEDSYLVIKRNAYRRKQNGVPAGSPFFHRSTWLGIFDKDTKTLVIPRNGRILFFNPETHEMKMGITIYKKQLTQ